MCACLSTGARARVRVRCACEVGNVGLGGWVIRRPTSRRKESFCTIRFYVDTVRYIEIAR